MCEGVAGGKERSGVSVMGGAKERGGRGSGGQRFNLRNHEAHQCDQPNKCSCVCVCVCCVCFDDKSGLRPFEWSKHPKNLNTQHLVLSVSLYVDQAYRRK